jgi:hypothetical protein
MSKLKIGFTAKERRKRIEKDWRDFILQRTSLCSFVFFCGELISWWQLRRQIVCPAPTTGDPPVGKGVAAGKWQLATTNGKTVAPYSALQATKDRPRQVKAARACSSPKRLFAVIAVSVSYPCISVLSVAKMPSPLSFPWP